MPFTGALIYRVAKGAAFDFKDSAFRRAAVAAIAGTRITTTILIKIGTRTMSKNISWIFVN